MHKDEKMMILKILSSLMDESDTGALDSKMDLMDLPIDADGIMEDAPDAEIEIIEIDIEDEDGDEDLISNPGSSFLDKIDAINDKKKKKKGEEEE